MCPQYAYACGACDFRLDVLKKMQDAATPEECPNCTTPMQRLYEEAPAGKVAGGTPKFHHRKVK